MTNKEFQSPPRTRTALLAVFAVLTFISALMLAPTTLSAERAEVTNEPSAALREALERHFSNVPSEAVTICGASAYESAVVFEPEPGVQVVSGSNSNGSICAEVYDGEQSRGTLSFEPTSRNALWLGSSTNGEASTRSINLSEDERARELAAAQTPRSMAFAAYLFWDDERVVPLTEQGGGGCQSNPGGCSGTPDRCAGISIRAACNTHDDCYQCGWSRGQTRAQCDRDLFDDILAATGNPGCANTYYWGVRAFGWLFFRNPNMRPHFWGDVYSLGITLNACPQNMQYLCTTYLF